MIFYYVVIYVFFFSKLLGQVIYNDLSIFLQVSVLKGFFCNLYVKFDVGLLLDVVYNIVIDSDNKRVFKNIKVSSNQLLYVIKDDFFVMKMVNFVNCCKYFVFFFIYLELVFQMSYINL